MRGNRMRAGAVAVAGYILMCGGLSGTAGDWPAYHGDPGLRGVAEGELPATLVERWRYRAGSPITLTPVVAEGRIYAALENGKLVAVDLKGERVWEALLETGMASNAGGQEACSTAPLVVGGTLLVGTDRGSVVAFDARKGTRRWARKVGADILGSLNGCPLSGNRGTGVVVMSRTDGVLKLLTLEAGELVWSAKGVGRCDCPPSVADGRAVFGACDSALHAIALGDGRTLATVPVGEHGPMAGGAAVDGHLAFVGTRDGSVACMDVREPSVVWIRNCASNEVFSTPAVTSNRVVAGSADGHLYGLDRSSGKTVWRSALGDTPSSAVIAGRRVVVTAGGSIFLLNLEDGGRHWMARIADGVTSSAVWGSQVVVGTDDGFLILYGPPRSGQEQL